MIIGRSPIAIVLMFCALPLMADPMPRPPGLEPDIGFWRKVFAEVTSEQALVHDNRNLAVIYEQIDLPSGSSDRMRRRISDRARARYRRILNHLADGERQGLTLEERRVLTLWPDDVSDDELRRAAGRVRFQQGLADRYRDGYVRSGRWQQYIRNSLQKAGVPESLAALPHVESSFNPEARSYVGASGLWQFTRSTGRRFMQIDHVVDERRDPFLSSDAAARLLADNYSILKSWPLAITAYNHGVAGVRRAVRKTGTDDIEVILRSYKGRSFGFASRNFYVAFLAAHDVEQNTDIYFGVLERDHPRPEIVVTLPDFMPTNTLASAFGVSTELLNEHNPALLKSVWSGTKFVPRGFPLRLPDSDYGMDPEFILSSIPSGQRYSAQTPDLQHRVERGDSLSVIAVRYRTSVSELMTLNNLRSRHRIRVGQTLNLPYRGGAALAAIPEGAKTYTVQRGDTIGVIASRAGVAASDLLVLNGLPDRNRIYPGQQLLLIANATEIGAQGPELVAAEIRVASPPGEIAPDLTSIPMAVADDPIEPEADIIGKPAEQNGDSVLLADPSDYFVAADGTIEVQAAETLGHYADWLDIRTQKLRDLNGLSFRQPVVIGHRLRLDFSAVDREKFTGLRITYHRELQEAFFTRFRIVDTTVHRLRRGESLYVLTLRRYKIPVWLLRQYNPDLDLNRVRTGVEIIIPQIESVGSLDAPAPGVARAF